MSVAVEPEIVSAEGFAAAALREAMAAAFADYEVPLRLSQADFDFMMRQRGLDRAASKLALVEGVVAAVWLVSVRDAAAYLIASGTQPRYRSRGLARKLAEHCLSDLRSADVESFQAEVLTGNRVAKTLYLGLGMRVVRTLDCHEIPAGAGAAEAPSIAIEPWERLAGGVDRLRDWPPSWQNGDRSLGAIADGLVCATARDDRGLAGYAVLIPETATLAQIAVRPDRRRNGLGRALVERLRQAAPDKALRVINADAGDDGFRTFLDRLGARQTAGQFELWMRLVG